MIIPERHKTTILELVEADPEVAQATCDIPHLDPSKWLKDGGPDGELPYCGCFIGVYGWMQQCQMGNDNDITGYYIVLTVARGTGVGFYRISEFGAWCNTAARDQAAVVYARDLLDKRGAVQDGAMNP